MREARPTKQSLDKAQVTPADAPSAYERSLIEASLDPLVAIDANGTITDVNESAVQITGLAREIFRASQHRVQSIALVHEKLYQSADLSYVDFSDYTVALLDNLFETFDAGQRGISKMVDIGDIRLSVDIAIPCGLIVNELVTNSLKHAFPGGGEGTVRVILREGADECWS